MSKFNFDRLDLSRYSYVQRITLQNIQRRFLANANRTGGGTHNPSLDQWLALADLVRCLDSLVSGEVEPKVYATSLDPGLGKTTALIAFLDVLLAQQGEHYASCGVLVAMNTLDEIERFIREVGIPQEDLAVWTSRDDLNAFGRSDRENARVLITTHERIGIELKEVELWSASSLHYLGSVRRLRVWDEAFLPGCPISLNIDDVLTAMKALRCVSVKLRDEIKAVFDHIETLPDGAVYQVPDYLGRHGVSLNEIVEIAYAQDPNDEVQKKLNDAQSEILTGIALVSGKRVKIRVDGRYGHASVDYHDTMPIDLAPILVMDASSRPGVRKTYDDLEHSRKIVVRLRHAPKSYRNLTVHVWQRGGGKASWKEQADNLLKGIVETVKTKPHEQWLVVHHKVSRGIPDIPKALAKLLPADVFKRLHFTNWGKHKATNRFSHVSNIILAGTLFLRPSQYEARKRLSAGLDAEHDVSAEELAAFQLGEQADDILQALCRGSVRLSDGDTCPKTDAYIIASVRSGIRAALPVIFPGCAVKPWRPLKQIIGGDAGKAIKIVEAWATRAGKDDVLRYTDISQRLGIDKRQFKGIRRENASYRNAIADLGLIDWGPNVYFVGYRKA